jgi:hypothetical protein
MSYATIQPPFTLRFREMPKKELLEYAAWFHSITPERITELAKAVKDTPGFEGWQPDLTPESLESLGRWFQSQVETRKKTAEEVEEIRSKLTFPIEFPENELTNKSFSLAMDIGMYFGQVVAKNMPGTRWDQYLKNKKDADYGQPVLMGFGAAPLNPVSIGVTTAYAISRKKPARLREIYDTWAKLRK